MSTNSQMMGKVLPNGASKYLQTDANGYLYTVSAAAAAVADGNTFFGSDISLAVADAGVVNWVIITGTEQPLMTFVVSAVGDFEIDLYEDVVTTDDGTAQTNFNFNRASSNTVQTLVYITPTIDTDGTLIAEALINGGTKNSATGSSSEGSILLKTSSKYMVRYTNKSGVTVNVNPTWTIIES